MFLNVIDKKMLKQMVAFTQFAILNNKSLILFKNYTLLSTKGKFKIMRIPLLFV